MKAIINAGTGEVTIRELTPDEQAERAAEQAAWEAGAAQRAYDDAVAERKARYQSESDPLLAEWLYDNEKGNPAANTKRAAWVAQVDQIKADIPLPVV